MLCKYVQHQFNRLGRKGGIISEKLIPRTWVRESCKAHNGPIILEASSERIAALSLSHTQLN